MSTVKLIQITSDELESLFNAWASPQFDKLSQQLSNLRPKGKEIMSRIETAELLGISLPTLHHWNKVGIIKFYKLGNRTYIKRSEILETLSNSNLKVS